MKYIMVIKPEQVEAEVSHDITDILNGISLKVNESTKKIKLIAKETQRISDIFEKLGTVERDINFITAKNLNELKD